MFVTKLAMTLLSLAGAAQDPRPYEKVALPTALVVADASGVLGNDGGYYGRYGLGGYRGYGGDRRWEEYACSGAGNPDPYSRC